ncbi:hypothetical protein K1W54_41110 [Micromonospora sp. CPCC 205371]|nr:hypothetical protein [Micromonospora sp. CPCC 205371]
MTMATAKERMTVISRSPPSTPRLRMEPTGSRRTLLDGGWWPRSTDPVAELPGLILAIDTLRGPVTRLVLAAAGWDSHPRRLGVNGRVIRLGYFTSQPVSLLTAICGHDRVDLLVVPPRTATGTADAALVVAATTGNLVHAQHIVLTAVTPHPSGVDGGGQDVWEAEGGHLGSTPTPVGQSVR